MQFDRARCTDAGSCTAGATSCRGEAAATVHNFAPTAQDCNIVLESSGKSSPGSCNATWFKKPFEAMLASHVFMRMAILVTHSETLSQTM
eukprot:2902012-Amphidinium_carterae.1